MQGARAGLELVERGATGHRPEAGVLAAPDRSSEEGVLVAAHRRPEEGALVGPGRW